MATLGTVLPGHPKRKKQFRTPSPYENHVLPGLWGTRVFCGGTVPGLFLKLTSTHSAQTSLVVGNPGRKEGRRSPNLLPQCSLVRGLKQGRWFSQGGQKTRVSLTMPRGQKSPREGSPALSRVTVVPSRHAAHLRGQSTQSPVTLDGR